MKPACALLTCILLMGLACLAQQTEVNRTARISGLVVKDPGGEPVKKALVELIAEDQSEGQNYTAITGSDGLFLIDGVVAGRYRLFAERTGYLEFDKSHPRVDGRVVTIRAGQELKELVVHFRAAAVVEGRVSDEDGDPLPEAQVAMLRQTYSTGRSHWEQVAAERTNDLGQYRIANLPAGTYFVSVTPPPNFKSLIEGSSKSGDTRDNSGSPGEKRRAMSYATTYYPDTRDRSQASPVLLHAGDDFPVNFSLVPVPSVAIRGRIMNFPSHGSASVTLQSRDSNSTLSGAEVRKDGTFEIRDVSPGKYTVVATLSDISIPMTARQSVQVLGDNIEDLRLAPQAGAPVRGQLRVESQRSQQQLQLSQLFLSLVSDDDSGGVSFGEGFSPLAHVNRDGSFEWKDVPAGHYYVQLSGGGAGQDWFLKSARAGGRDAAEDGFTTNGGAVALEVVASASGATAEGFVTNAKGEPVPNATVVAVPEPRLRSRVDRFLKATSDQRGHFIVRAVPPGSYTLLAWEIVDGEAYYDREFLKVYEAQGTTLNLAEGDHKQTQLTAIPAPADQE